MEVLVSLRPPLRPNATCYISFGQYTGDEVRDEAEDAMRLRIHISTYYILRMRNHYFVHVHVPPHRIYYILQFHTTKVVTSNLLTLEIILPTWDISYFIFLGHI